MHTDIRCPKAIVGSTLLATIEQLAFNVLALNEDGLRTSNIGMHGLERCLLCETLRCTCYHNSFTFRRFLYNCTVCSCVFITICTFCNNLLQK